MEKNELKIPVEQLRRVCNPEDFPFENTAEVPPVRGFIGQERVVMALETGLGIDDSDYNIYVGSKTGISRRSVLMEQLDKHAEEKAAAGQVSLRDFCSVYNFNKPDEPKVLVLNQGDGKKLENSLRKILDEARKHVPLILRSDDCLALKNNIVDELTKEVEEIHNSLSNQAKEAGFTVVPDRKSGRYYIRPLSRDADGAPRESVLMLPEEYNSLNEEERATINKKQRILDGHMVKIFQKAMDLQEKAEQETEDLERRLITQNFLKDVAKEFTKKYFYYPEVIAFFQQLQDYILDEYIDLFSKNDGQELNGHNGNGNGLFVPFKVNVLINNSQARKPPVIFESNPTFGNLFGKIEGRFIQGAYLSDHTSLKAGSLLQADGGYLVLNVVDVLSDMRVWQKLEKTIKYGYLEIEEPMESLGLARTGLKPKAIPVRLKVILVGESDFYHLLMQYDPKFPEIFKIKAETDSTMPLTQDAVMAYAGFIARCSEKEEDLRQKKIGLLPFDRSAVGKIVEYGHRLAGSQTKLSTEFNKIKELAVESSYLAREAGSNAVSAEHIKKSLETQRLRANLIESKLQERIKDDVVLIDTKGEKVGQINGLAVYSFGDYSFGLPARITAETFAGKNGVVSIDREVKMSGPIHDKGVKILSGYFHAKYGKDKPISFSASICFEQSYNGIEGDSASAAELFCLISSLSGLPIKQCFAVTGSVNQKGEIQPIGGVNQKIEGFFDVCKERGLTGEQGVIIPHQNIKNLMLREDVVEACAKGEFRIYAMKTVDKGLELLLCAQSAEGIHNNVSSRLSEMTRALKDDGQRDSNKVSFFKKLMRIFRG